MKIFVDERGIKYTNESLLKGIAAHTQFNYIGDNSSDAFNNSYLFGPISSEVIDGIWIPDSVKRNQNLGNRMPSSEFMDGCQRASTITGIPLYIYVCHGALESGWTNARPNKYGYGGYFGQKTNQGGTGSAFDQACGQGIRSCFNSAMKDNHGFRGADLYVWTYLVHNAGPGGASHMLNILGGKLRHSSPEPYYAAGNGVAQKYNWPQSSAVEKALAIPKSFYIYMQVAKKGLIS